MKSIGELYSALQNKKIEFQISSSWMKPTWIDLLDDWFGIENMLTVGIALEDNTTLKKLTLSNIRFANNESELAFITVLSEGLKHNRTLESLDLSYTGLNENSISLLTEALKLNTVIKLLKLGATGIGEKKAEAIASLLKVNTHITCLDLYANYIGSKGVKALSDAVKDNKTLSVLGLGDNKLSDKHIIPLLLGLMKNKNLKNLDLYENNITSIGAKEIIQFLPNLSLKRLDLSRNQFTSDIWPDFCLGLTVSKLQSIVVTRPAYSNSEILKPSKMSPSSSLKELGIFKIRTIMGIEKGLDESYKTIPTKEIYKLPSELQSNFLDMPEHNTCMMELNSNSL